MNLPTSIDQTSGKQKIVAGLLLVGCLYLAYYLLPPLVFILKNLWLMIILGVPLLYCIVYPLTVWNMFKTASWSLTKKWISLNKVEVLERCYEYIVNRQQRTEGLLNQVTQIRIKEQRRQTDLSNSIEDNMRKAVEAKKQNNNSLYEQFSMKVNFDTKMKESSGIRLNQLVEKEKLFKQMFELQSGKIVELRYSIDGLVQEYEAYRTMNNVTKNMNEFLNSDDENAKLFKESLRQIEDSTTLYIANVENFEEKAKPLIESMNVEKSANILKGTNLIQEYNRISDIKFQIPQTVKA